MGEVINGLNSDELFSPGIWPDAVQRLERLNPPCHDFDSKILLPSDEHTRSVSAEAQCFKFDNFGLFMIRAIDKVFRSNGAYEYHLQYEPSYDLRKLTIINALHEPAQLLPDSEDINFQLDSGFASPTRLDMSNFKQLMDDFDRSLLRVS